MTTHLITRLQQLASTMPRFVQHNHRRLPGSALLEMGYDHWQGRPVDPGTIYTVAMQHETNHVRMLTRIYQARGYRAVLEHVKRFTQN